MTINETIQLVFWLAVLAGWLCLIVYGIAWIDKKIDRLLDRWFHPIVELESGHVKGGYLKPRRSCWPCYLDTNYKMRRWL